MAWHPRRLSFLSPSTDKQRSAKPPVAPGSLTDVHNAACAWFLGPKAENADYLKIYVDKILDDLTQCRRNFSPQDQVST
jgi:hypothetical protein